MADVCRVSQWLELIICLIFVSRNNGADDKCNLKTGMTCAGRLTHRYDSVYTGYKQAHNVTDNVLDLCLDDVNGNFKDKYGKSSLSDCFKQSTAYCQSKPYDLMMQWNETERDIKDICKEVCPDYSAIAECADMVESRVDANGNGKTTTYDSFCKSYNQSLECAAVAMKSCQFGDFWKKLQPVSVITTWERLCKTGCSNIDFAFDVFQNCSDYIVLSENNSHQCSWYWYLHQCLHVDGVCPEVISLLDSQSRSHFKTLGPMCTTTSTTTTTTSTTIPTTTTTTSTTTTPTTTTTTTPTTAVTTTLPTTSTSTMKMSETTVSPKELPPTTVPSELTTTHETSTVPNEEPRQTTDLQPTNTKRVFESVVSNCVNDTNIGARQNETHILSLELCRSLLLFTACLEKGGFNVSKVSSEPTIPILIQRALLNGQHLVCLHKYPFLEQEIDHHDNKPVLGCSGHSFGIIYCKNGGSVLLQFSVLVHLVIIGLERKFMKS